MQGTRELAICLVPSTVSLQRNVPASQVLLGCHLVERWRGSRLRFLKVSASFCKWPDRFNNRCVASRDKHAQGKLRASLL